MAVDILIETRSGWVCRWRSLSDGESPSASTRALRQAQGECTVLVLTRLAVAIQRLSGNGHREVAIGRWLPCPSMLRATQPEACRSRLAKV